MLKLKRYPKRSPYWLVRGTVAGVRIFESTGTTDRQQAEAFRIRLERETWERGALGQERPATFADAVMVYLDRGRSRRFVVPLLHYFKERPLSEIGQTAVDRAANSLYPNCKSATLVRQVYGPVIAILNSAIKAELPGARPQKISMPRVAKVQPKWGSDEHLARLLPECSPQLKALVLVMTYTGLRVGECLRARRPDFALKPGWVNVARTKNGDPAFVPLPPAAVEALDAIMPAGLEPVFGYRTSQGANKALARAARRAGVEYLSCHQIGRHTFAARILGAGYDIKTLKEAGRWKKLSVVDDAYGHLEQRQYHDAMLAVARRK
jgi:integrase